MIGFILLVCLSFPVNPELPSLAGDETEMARMLALDFEVFGVVQGVFFRKVSERHLASVWRLTMPTCYNLVVHAKTRQGAGSEGMVHEHPERHRRRPFGGGERADRGDVRTRHDERERLLLSVASLCFISGKSGFVAPEALSRGSTRQSSATRRKSRSCRSPTLKSESRISEYSEWQRVRSGSRVLKG
ncbi:PREDICTED: uncharacterized protein LOC105565672 isoform X2 [Vollenhovia emeryi]|uniref:uncharacterized protein LOC105565672 isoform X2 n=1 Tax=Vollenhovia emeryi TaxID=411798 RepID=UPI0005F3C57E|nr:PREDICTED: uncharacterized protein LOC105565672 isoform X2 [Vollenhovia emeryi]